MPKPFWKIRYDTVSVLESGPPLVNAMIWSNAPSEFLRLRTMLIVKKGPISGKVICQKFCQAFTPSMDAAS